MNDIPKRGFLLLDRPEPRWWQFLARLRRWLSPKVRFEYTRVDNEDSTFTLTRTK